MQFGLGWGCWFKVGVSGSIGQNHLQGVEIKEPAQRPIAGLAVWFFARAFCTCEAPYTGKPQGSLDFRKVLTYTGSNQVFGRLYGLAQWADKS